MKTQFVHINLKKEDDIDLSNYSYNPESFFTEVPEVSRSLVKEANKSLKKIEKLLYNTPAFLNTIKSSVPKSVLQAVLTDEQEEGLARGVLKLMTKKDGTLMANLINPDTKKIVSTIPLEEVQITPEISQSLVSFLHKCKWHRLLNKFKVFKLLSKRLGKDKNMIDLLQLIVVNRNYYKQ